MPVKATFYMNSIEAINFQSLINKILTFTISQK